MKIEIIRKNSKVCFEFDSSVEIIEHENACNWDMKYLSVIGFGNAVFIEDVEEKRVALGVITSQYSQRPFSFPDDSIARTTVIKVDIESMTGKQFGL